MSKENRMVLMGLLTILVLSNPVSTAYGYWSMDKNGNMTQYKAITNQVLGEEDSKQEEIKQEEVKHTEEKKNEEIKKLEETKKSDKSASDENKIDPKKIESVEIHKAEVKKENEIEDKNKVEASGEGDIEVDIKKTDKKEIKEKQESFEMETENGDKVHVELSPEKTQFEITKNGVSASIDLPLSVDPLLKRIVVSTSDGDKILESLPDDVVNNLKKEKRLANNSKVQINLKVENGQVIYHIEEVKHKKVAGIVPVDLIKNLSVSSSTGVVLSEQESLLTKILNFISI
jgi:hypothetical protein